MRVSNIFGLILSILETYIFVGIFYGWHELKRLFKVSSIDSVVLSDSREIDKYVKDENVFGFKCLTDQTLSVPSEDIHGSGAYPQPGMNITCAAQDQEFARIFQLGYSLGMIISFPLGTARHYSLTEDPPNHGP